MSKAKLFVKTRRARLAENVEDKGSQIVTAHTLSMLLSMCLGLASFTLASQTDDQCDTRPVHLQRWLYGMGTLEECCVTVSFLAICALVSILQATAANDGSDDVESARRRQVRRAAGDVAPDDDEEERLAELGCALDMLCLTTFGTIYLSAFSLAWCVTGIFAAYDVEETDPLGCRVGGMWVLYLSGLGIVQSLFCRVTTAVHIHRQKSQRAGPPRSQAERAQDVVERFTRWLRRLDGRLDGAAITRQR